MERDEVGWVCRECGSRHDGLITCFGPDEPLAWHDAGRIARMRGTLERSLCVVKVDGIRRLFVRGHLHIPIHDNDVPEFAWNVWVEVDPTTFGQILDSWEDPARVDLPVSKAVLDTPLPYAETTRGLAVEVRHGPPGEVPRVTVPAGVDHPLRDEQQRGMNRHRLAEINSLALGELTPPL